MITFKIALPIPAYSDYYSLEVIIDGDGALPKSIDLRALPATAPGQPQP